MAEKRTESLKAVQRKKQAKLARKIRNGADIEIKHAKTTWGGRLAYGFNIVYGNGGVGKTTLIAHIVSHILKGEPLEGTLSNELGATLGSVLYITLDDELPILVNRIRAAGMTDIGNPAMSYIGAMGSVLTEEDLSEDIETWCSGELKEGRNPQLVVVDTLLQITPSNGSDALRKTGANLIGGALKQIADKHQLYVIGVTHRNKGWKQSKEDSVMGGGWADNCRSLLLFGETEDPEVFGLWHMKANHSRKALAAAFSMTDVSLGDMNGVQQKYGKLEFIGEYPPNELHEKAYVEGRSQTTTQVNPKEQRRDQLRDLIETQGPLTRTQIMETAKDTWGVKDRTAGYDLKWLKDEGLIVAERDAFQGETVYKVPPSYDW